MIKSIHFITPKCFLIYNKKNAIIDNLFSLLLLRYKNIGTNEIASFEYVGLVFTDFKQLRDKKRTLTYSIQTAANNSRHCTTNR